jgi:hypothetical protein
MATPKAVATRTIRKTRITVRSRITSNVPHLPAGASLVRDLGRGTTHLGDERAQDIHPTRR